MTKQYFSILTQYGSQALSQAIASRTPLQITQMAVGDGNGAPVQPTAQRTALAREVYRANISAISQDPRNNKQVIFELTIPENVGGFYVREMGIFDNQNRLLAYANCPDSFKPTLESGSGKVQVLRMILLVSSSDAVTLSVDDSVIFATRGQLAPQTINANSTNSFDSTGHSHAIEQASTTQKGIVQLTNDTGLDSENLGLTAKAGKKLAQIIATVQQALGNYIKNDKKSDSVDSTSSDTVATSAAVKSAYDKAESALSVANSKQSPATTLAGYGITDGVNKKGDALNGNLKLKVNRQAYSEQLRTESPLYMPQISWNGDAYYPLIKVLFAGANGNSKNATFGVGVRTFSQQNYGSGVITYCADDNSVVNWYFHKNGDFVSPRDVIADNGLSIKNLITNTFYPNHYSGAKVLKLKIAHNNGWKIMSIYAPNIQIPASGEVIINLPEAMTSNAVVIVTDNGNAKFSYGAIMHGTNKVKIFAPANKICGFQIQVTDGGVAL